MSILPEAPTIPTPPPQAREDSARQEWVLMGASVIFLIAYAWPILQPTLDHTLRRACTFANWLVWALFAATYVRGLVRAEDRLRYLRTHVIDLFAVCLPVLRPLRLLRLISVLGVLNRGVSFSLQGRVATYIAGSSLLLGFCGALAMLDAERGAPGANIENFGDALWWSIVTMTTVGYGDVYPVTTTGRIVAGTMMVGGIALIGSVTASVATWLTSRVAEEERDETQLEAEVRGLRDDVRRLTEVIEAREDREGP